MGPQKLGTWPLLSCEYRQRIDEEVQAQGVLPGLAPWVVSYGISPTEALALGITPPLPLQPVFLFSASLQDPPLHTTLSLMAQGSTFHTLSWG